MADARDRKSDYSLLGKVEGAEKRQVAKSWRFLVSSTFWLSWRVLAPLAS